MMSCLRFEEKVARKDHSSPCRITGVPIEKGDIFLSVAGVFDGDFSAYKAHPIIHQICLSQTCSGEPFSLNEGLEYLWWWLCGSLDENMAMECLDEARGYWRRSANR